MLKYVCSDCSKELKVVDGKVVPCKKHPLAAILVNLIATVFSKSEVV